MKNKGSKRFAVLISIIIIIIAGLWFIGFIRLWIKGIAYIAYNTEDISDGGGHIVNGEYSLSINLKDLESNIGKELYNDGENKIYVAWMDNTGDIMSGGYRIGFRSSGHYSINNATLVSGIHHEYSDNSYLETMTANMVTKYNGKIYNSREYGTSSLNYKDGDDFAFYIFPSEVYESGEVSLEEEGIAEITVNNLFNNIWIKN